MKQVVEERWYGDYVKINTSYSFDPELIGKKEWEEISYKDGEFLVKKYWVRVGNPVKGMTHWEWKEEQKREREVQKKIEIESKYKRIEFYRQLVEQGHILFEDSHGLPEEV